MTVFSFDYNENFRFCPIVVIILQAQMIQERNLSISSDQKRYKIIIIGDSNVGKTALFWRFTEGDFLADKSTQVTTIDFKMKDIMIKKKPIKLYIWDTAGQERYRSIVATYFKGCHGILMVFDLSKRNSFKNIQDQWYDLCKTKADKAMILLIGNKNDLQKQVNEQQVQQWCTKYRIKYISASVKTNTNVQQSFITLAKLINDQESKEVVIPRTESFALKKNHESAKRQKKCC